MSGKRLPGGTCGVLAAALVLWALFLRPLPAHFGSAIPHSSRTAPGASRVETLRPGDHLQLLYHFQLVGQMVSGRIRPFANPYEFNLGEDARRIDPYYVPFSLVFAASRPLFGKAAAWNLAQLASVLVGAWFLFLLARRWSGEGPDAALLAAAAALAATCVPYRWETLAGGSPTGFGMAWIPGVALGVDIAVRDRRASGGLLAGVLLLLCYTTDLHCFLFALLALPLWAVLSWIGRPADRLLPDRAETRGVVVALLPLAGFVALSGGIAFALRRLYAATDAAGGRTIADLRSPFPEGLIDPASPTFMAAQVFLGWGFAALFAIAAVCAVRRLVRSSGTARRRAAAALLVCAVLVFAVLLALANRGPWDGLAVRAARKLVPPFRMVRQPIKVFCLLPTLLAPLLAWVLGERASRPSETGKDPVPPPPCDSPSRALLRRIAPPALVLLLAALPLAAAPHTIIRNAAGKFVASAEIEGDKTTYKNAEGRVTGTAEVSGNRTTYKNAEGTITGTAETANGRTIYRDASGRFAGTAETNGNHTIYRDANGNTIGTADSANGRITYRDASGRFTSAAYGAAATPAPIPLFRRRKQPRQ